MSAPGYLDSPWPGEDGGPRRLQTPRHGPALAVQPGERLACVTRNTLLSTMTVLGAPGEVYLLTHSALRSHVGLPTTACVERIDPLTLQAVQRSPRLAGGPMWPGGMAIHRNGAIHVVHGRHAHQLRRACEPMASLRLPVNQPYNAFVILDNGRHRYRTRMIGAGVSRGANRLIRVSLRDAAEHQAIDVCGAPGGSVTNPPLVDLRRRIVVGYDSANRHLRAWRFEPHGGALQPLWHKRGFGCASHMLLYPDTGELLVNDYRRLGEEVVLLDIASGNGLSRARSGGLTQGVVFPSTGWNRDLCWSSMGRLARIFVQ